MAKYQGVSTLEVLEEARNYNQWIAEMFLKHISPPVLEIGSGIGNISTYFSHYPDVYFSDSDQELVNLLKKKFPEHSESILTIDISKEIKEKFLHYFSTIIAINVLEHIFDDEKALKNIYTALRKNGNFLVLVPAKKFAYTKLDKEVGHFRRYEKKELIEKLAHGGFSVTSIQFFNIVGLVSWIIRDKIGKNPHLKPHHITLFDSIVPILKRGEAIIKPPIGVSLIAVAKKA